MGNRGAKTRMGKYQNNKTMDLTPTVPLIAWHGSELNNQLKRQRFSYWGKKEKKKMLSKRNSL